MAYYARSAADRRAQDRRGMYAQQYPSYNYTGPERRTGDRRAGKDRRAASY